MKKLGKVPSRASCVFERTTPLKPAFRECFKNASSKRGLRSNFFLTSSRIHCFQSFGQVWDTVVLFLTAPLPTSENIWDPKNKRVSNHHLQKWTACQERPCRNVNKQERYHPPPNPPNPPPPPHPTPPHPTPPPHPIPPPRTNPGMPTRNYKRNSVKKHSKTRGKWNDAHENKTARETTRMLRQWEKHENVSKTHDALEGTSPKTSSIYHQQKP